MAHIPSRNGHSYHGVTIGDHAHDIHLGDKVGVTINTKVAARTDFVGHYSHKALLPVPTFVDRSDLREGLRARCLSDISEDGGHGRIVIVHGAGGVGKSQLVFNFVQLSEAETTDAPIRCKCSDDMGDIICRSTPTRALGRTPPVVVGMATLGGHLYESVRGVRRIERAQRTQDRCRGTFGLNPVLYWSHRSLQGREVFFNIANLFLGQIPGRYWQLFDAPIDPCLVNRLFRSCRAKEIPSRIHDSPKTLAQQRKAPVSHAENPTGPTSHE
ncbi:MAG: hypothetical protein HETSPECPRED_006295 [Heterodermia speciosa]|uniref:Uncharacterized protein n=1 Tax=Heterodermia speciosa TaxID=116794 RepID=A0A8H3ITV8_9LECA|nr:MAG: hypothetical protein HETSPECPRED_006295 [Heterodermia speciosa]